MQPSEPGGRRPRSPRTLRMGATVAVAWFWRGLWTRIRRGRSTATGRTRMSVSSSRWPNRNRPCQAGWSLIRSLSLTAGTASPASGPRRLRLRHARCRRDLPSRCLRRPPIRIRRSIQVSATSLHLVLDWLTPIGFPRIASSWTVWQSRLLRRWSVLRTPERGGWPSTRRYWLPRWPSYSGGRREATGRCTPVSIVPARSGRSSWCRAGGRT
jgi:hypothetical protein